MDLFQLLKRRWEDGLLRGRELGRIGLRGYALLCVLQETGKMGLSNCRWEAAPSHRLSCLTLPVSTRLKSLSGRVRFGHPAGSWRNWRELLLSPSCFSLGKHICWRHLASPGSLSESQCRCPRPCARTARNQQVLGAGPPVQASCSASGISPRVGRLDQGWPVQCLWTFDSYTLPSILWVK